jgi:hypothetical protein
MATTICRLDRRLWMPVLVPRRTCRRLISMATRASRPEARFPAIRLWIWAPMSCWQSQPELQSFLRPV